MKAEDTLAALRTESAVHADCVYSQSCIYNALRSIAHQSSFVRILSGLARADVKEKNKENCNLSYLKETNCSSTCTNDEVFNSVKLLYNTVFEHLNVHYNHYSTIA